MRLTPIFVYQDLKRQLETKRKAENDEAPDCANLKTVTGVEEILTRDLGV